MLDLAPSTIGQYETNRREPNFKRLARIVEFFNVDYNFLLYDEKDNREAIERIELDIVDLKEILIKNYVLINGKRISDKAKEGLLIFLENI